MVEGNHNGCILVIDAYDEGDMYAEALRKWGFDVATASTAAQGLAAARTMAPDIIVQGVAFPDLSGAELARQLKQAVRSRPLIVLSGFRDERTLQSIQASGCDAVLEKPCLPSTLLGEIRGLLRPQRGGRG
jgi:two-component system OmpR family response regulator